MKDATRSDRGILFVRLLSLLLFCSSATFCISQDVLILNEDKPTADQDQAVPGEGEDEISDLAFAAFYQKWAEFEQAYRVADVNQQDRHLNELARMRIQNGIPKLTELAVAAVQYGRLDLSQKKPETALKLFKAAAALDPSLPSAYYSQGQTYLARGISGFVPALRAGVAGFLAPLTNLSGRLYFFGKVALILTAALLFLGLVFSVVLFLKYRKLFQHDMLERLTRKDSTLVAILSWVVLFLPVFLFFGFLWLAPFWFLLFWGYARNSEKIVAAVFFIIFILAYPVYQGVVKTAAATQDPSIANFVSFFSEGPTLRMLSEFERYHAQNPADLDAAIILAHIYTAEQRTNAATDLLQKHIAAHPSDARAHNNLAVLFYDFGETDSAIRIAEKAAELDSRNAIYPYNLAHLSRAKFNFSDAERLLGRARDLNPALIRSLESQPKQSMIQALPDESLVAERIRKKTGSPEDLLFNPFSIFSILLLIATLMFHFQKRKKWGHARACVKCGLPFCKRCQSSDKEFRFCTQCMHIFIRKDGVSPVSRKEKMREIDQYTRRQVWFMRLSSLLLPGFGNLYRNQTLSGILILLIWSLLGALILFNWRFAGFSYLEPAENLRIVTLACLCFMTLIYLLANVSLLKKSAA